MEKRIEPLLPKGSNAGGEEGGGYVWKCSTGNETARRPRALRDIYICIV